MPLNCAGDAAVVGVVVDFVVGVAVVPARIGARARCQAAAIFFSPEVPGWKPSPWLSATPSYPVIRSAIVTGETAVESPAASDGSAPLNATSPDCWLNVPLAVGMICATTTLTFGFFWRRRETIALTFWRRVVSGTPVRASFVPM